MSSSSSPSSSSSEDGNGYALERAADFEGPSLTRPRGNNETWPGAFVEDLVVRVATDASRFLGRLAAAAALANLFQVCSTWQAVSRSDPLWQRLTMAIWGRTHRMRETWHEEYIFRHRTSRNFRAGISFHGTLHFDPSDVENPDGMTCLCLALSDNHLACGFADGTVRLFDLATRLHVSTIRPNQRDRFGRFSRAVSGIVISHHSLTFATLDGDIYVAIIGGELQARRAHMGNVVDDGALVDFSGRGWWCVGLYAGVPDRAIRIWDVNTEELILVSTTLTNRDALVGWHALTAVTNAVGRVRLTGQELAVACTSSRYMVLDLRNPVFPLHNRFRRGLTVTSFDANNEAFVIVDSRGVGIVRRVDTLEEVCRLYTGYNDVVGCINLGYALMCAEGEVRVWEIEHGQLLYTLSVNVGDVPTMVADDRHVAVVSNDTTIHLWDFGAQ